MKTSCTALGISGVALAISLYAAIRTNPVTWDLLGVLAAILSVLVTILIGWQIYNVISFERKMEKSISKAEDNLKIYVNAQIKNVANLLRCDLSVTQAANFSATEDWVSILNALLVALFYSTKARNYKLDSILNSILGHIAIINAGNINIEISEADKNRWLGYIIQVNDMRVFEIADFIRNIKVKG